MSGFRDPDATRRRRPTKIRCSSQPRPIPAVLSQKTLIFFSLSIFYVRTPLHLNTRLPTSSLTHTALCSKKALSRTHCLERAYREAPRCGIWSRGSDFQGPFASDCSPDLSRFYTTALLIIIPLREPPSGKERIVSLPSLSDTLLPTPLCLHRPRGLRPSRSALP